MKRQSLFWKTWIITDIIILLSMAIFVGFLSISSTFFIKQQQVKLLQTVHRELEQYVQQYGMDSDFLDKYYQQGVFIVVQDEHKNQIYPNNSTHLNTGIYFSEAPTIEVAPVPEIEQALTIENNISFESKNSDIIFDTFNVSYNNQSYTIRLLLPATANQLILLHSLGEFIPEFLIVAFIVSGGASALYARYFTRKIKRLNRLIDAMGARCISPQNVAITKTGDELWQLENDLFKMYGNLLQTVAELEQEVAYSQRLENDRSVFMKGATHELKTPIMIMNSMLEGMLENIPEYADTPLYIKACYDELQKMTQLVQEILDVARLEHLKFDGETNITAILTSLIEDYRPLIEDKKLQITFPQLEQSEAHISDKNIKKVFSNLLMNAIKYTPYGREIQITLTADMLQIQNDTYAMEYLDEKRLTTAFISYQDKQKTEIKGHGLGLYVVDYILKQYGFSYSYWYDDDSKQFCFQILL